MGCLLFSHAGADGFSEENTVMLINEVKAEQDYFSPQFKDNSCFKGMFLVHYKLSCLDNICGMLSFTTENYLDSSISMYRQAVQLLEWKSKSKYILFKQKCAALCKSTLLGYFTYVFLFKFFM